MTMRLFMTTDAVGGVGKHALDLARGLVPYGVETVLAVLGPEPDREFEDAARSIPGLSLMVTALPLDWTASSPRALEEAGLALAQLAAGQHVDLVHLNSPALAAFGRYRVPVVVGCHSCLATWWQAVREGPLPPDFAWRTELVRRGYETADALVAPSAAFAAATARAYGLTREPSVVHNGRDIAPAGSPLDLGDFVFTAGRLWDEGKNLAALNRAAIRLAMPIVAAGPLAAPHGGSIDLPHLWTLGQINEAEIARYLGARPIFVSGALYEPFGLAVLEAAQAGCPLVLSDIPSFRELWDRAAEFVSPNDDEAIAGAVEAIRTDPVRRTRLGAAALARSQSYSVDHMAAGMMTLYRVALSNHHVRHLEAAE